MGQWLVIVVGIIFLGFGATACWNQRNLEAHSATFWRSNAGLDRGAFGGGFEADYRGPLFLLAIGAGMTILGVRKVIAKQHPPSQQ